MRGRHFIFSVATSIVLGSSAAAGPLITLPSIKWPDLIVSNLQITPSWTPVIGQVTFTVKEACGVKIAKPFHVALTIAAAPGGSPLFATTVVANPLPANGSQTWTIPLTAKAIPIKSFARVEADSQNEIVEDVETNNYQQLNPNVAPFPQNGATYCKPHKLTPVTPQP